MAQLVRFNGKWFQIVAKPYEPERQTMEIAWSMLREPSLKPPEAYRKWYEKEQQNAKVLYLSFRKEKNDA